MGLDFSERYHTDPVYRNESWKDVLRWVHTRFGGWGTGKSNPSDSYSVTTLDSVHMFPWLFGGKISYSVDKFPAIEEYPLAEIANLQDFTAGYGDADKRIQSLLDQAKKLVDAFGPENVSVPFYTDEDTGITDIEAAHCPLTIAYRLFGTRLLTEIFDNPDGVKHVFGEVMQLSKKLGRAFRQIAGIKYPENVFVGACAATFLGPEHFREFLMPAILDSIADRPFLFHSCGRVNHLFEVFGEMGQLCDVKIFDCREQAEIDLTKNIRYFSKG